MITAGGDAAGDDEAGPLPFGLDADGYALLGDLLAPLSGPLGVDMRLFLERLRNGATVGGALGLPTGLAEAIYARAHAQFSAGRRDKAEELFRALCVIDGADADHWVGYGVCLQGRGEDAEATFAYATAAAVRPGWAVPHYHAAQVALAAERWDAAREHLDAFAARSTPSLPAAMRQEAARQAAALRLRAELARGARTARS